MTSKIHERNLDIIQEDPRRACIYHPSQVWREVPIYEPNTSNHTLTTALDLVVRAAEGLFVVEYKCHDSEKQRQKALKQLIQGKEGLQQRRFYENELPPQYKELADLVGDGVPVHQWYVHGPYEEKFHAELLIKGNRGLEWYVIR